MTNKIRVMMGLNIKRESVLIDPSIGAGEPAVSADNAGDVSDPQNVIATGPSIQAILKRIYGR